MSISDRLAELGIVLPPVTPPAGNYVPWVRTGNLLFLAGQLPFSNGQLLVTGHLGAGMSIEQGQTAARQCAINLITQINDACGGDLSLVRRIVRLNGFVAGTPTFTDHPKVINGASDLFVAVFGDQIGKHSRVALGVAALPLNAAVEIDAVVELA